MGVSENVFCFYDINGMMLLGNLMVYWLGRTTKYGLPVVLGSLVIIWSIEPIESGDLEDA